MEIWNSNQRELTATALKGKTISKFDYPFSIEFTDGTAIEFDPGDDAWREKITYYEAGEARL